MQPRGILSVEILSCTNLMVADVTTSDPYVVIQLGDETQQTEVLQAEAQSVNIIHSSTLTHHTIA